MSVTIGPLDSLAAALEGALRRVFSDVQEIGQPELVEQASNQAKALFQEYSKARPSGKDAYAAALAFVRGKALDDVQYDALAGGLNTKIDERNGASPIASRRLEEALDWYEEEAMSDRLWRLTWFGLLTSYFSYDPQTASAEAGQGWASLRGLLQRTWPYIDRANKDVAVPDWLRTLREYPALITERATDEFAWDFLNGTEETLDTLTQCVGIPESSWFWHELVLSAVRACTEDTDRAFHTRIPHLLELIRSRPVYRDQALELILDRYYQLAERPVHEALRDYVVDKNVWRNPKLKDAGIATAWNRVPEEIWRMVLQWVNEGNLRDFFDVLAARNSADEGRLAFWSGYMKQITWTRLIFSSDTVMLARTNKDVGALLARESGAYATLTSDKNLDAFIMEIGGYIIVEFSTAGAAYVYESSKLKFDRYAKVYHGGTVDLKYGYPSGAPCRIVHRHPWRSKAAAQLRQLGLLLDDAVSKAKSQPIASKPVLTRSAPRRADLPVFTQIETRRDDPPAPQKCDAVRMRNDCVTVGPLTFAELQREVACFSGAYIDDRRQATGGRLWVEDPNQNMQLGLMLKSWGFKWANSRSAWYYVE
jgi:hypothetical protein